MNKWLSVVVALYFLIVGNVAQAEQRAYIETDGDSKILYKVTCNPGAKAKCTVETTKATPASGRCVVVQDTLFTDEPVTHSNGTYTLTRSRGACNYTNTFTFSAQGMLQTKTSPAVKALSSCDVFPPKSYSAELTATPGIEIKTKGCSDLIVLDM